MSVSAVSAQKTSTRQILGLLAGEGSLPAILAQSASARGYTIVALALSAQAAELVNPYCSKVIEVYPGQVGKNIKLAKAEGIEEAVLIGKVPKLNILQNITKLDWVALRELSKITSFSDHAVQQAVASVMEREGIKIRPQAEFLRHLFPEVGVLTKRQPTAAEYIDIEYGPEHR